MTEADRIRNDPGALERLIEEHRILKETVENAPVLFCVYDADDRLLAWNKGYESNHPDAFAHLHSQPPGTGLSYAEVVRFQMVKTVAAEHLEERVAERVAVQKSADGTPLMRHYDDAGWLQIHKYRLPSGAVAGFALDINSLKKREVELIEARRVAEETGEAKASFLAKMSHEIRTPMNGIIGMADSLRDSQLSPDQRLSLDTIVTSGENLMNLINDILDFSKIDAGKMELVLRPFSLLTEAEALCRLLAPRAHAAGLDLILDVDPTLDAPVVGDCARIRQVMTNLLGNAIKFTQTGHVLVRITSAQTDSSDLRDIRISVEDTGIGIPVDQQTRIFNAFEQVHDIGASKAGPGTGLGLSITTDLISVMGGTLTVESEPGNGARFTCHLTLPLARRAIDQVPRAEISTAPDASRGPVELIEPSDLHAAPLLRALDHLGYRSRRWRDLESWTNNAADTDHPVVLATRALPELPGTRAAVIDQLNRHPAATVVISHFAAGKLHHPPRHLISEPITLAGLQAGLVTPKPHSPRVAPATVPTSAAVAPGPLALHVLVAEDNRTNRLVIDRMLKSRVARLSFAENGQIAVEAAIADAPDLILMDMAMPVMGGLDAARALRAHESRHGLRRCPIYALTANVTDGDRAECIAAGMDNFLTKPVRMDRLMATLHDLVTAHRLTA